MSILIRMMIVDVHLLMFGVTLRTRDLGCAAPAHGVGQRLHALDHRDREMPTLTPPGPTFNPPPEDTSSSVL